MPCQVGITTRPEERRAEWERLVVGLRKWRIIGRHSRRDQAQEQEDRYAAQHGCYATHGGAAAPGPWFVYRFDYTRLR